MWKLIDKESVDSEWHPFDKIKNLKSQPGIYIISCIITNKFYVGESMDIRHRFSNHRPGKYQLIHKIMKKYGLDNFLFYIEYFPNFSKMELIMMEEILISKYKSLVPNGYNICSKGTDLKGRIVSEETRQKQSNSMKGKRCSPETRKKISESHKGKKASLETRQKISESKKGKRPSDETRRKMSVSNKNRDYNKNIKVSDDTKKKMSESKKGKPGNHTGKTHSDESKQKISLKMKGRVSNRKGVKLSEETKKKMSGPRTKKKLMTIYEV